MDLLLVFIHNMINCKRQVRLKCRRGSFVPGSVDLIEDNAHSQYSVTDRHDHATTNIFVLLNVDYVRHVRTSPSALLIQALFSYERGCTEDLQQNPLTHYSTV